MPVSRLAALATGNSNVCLPAFFPSVSSIKTGMSPVDYIASLRAMARRSTPGIAVGQAPFPTRLHAPRRH